MPVAVLSVVEPAVSLIGACLPNTFSLIRRGTSHGARALFVRDSNLGKSAKPPAKVLSDNSGHDGFVVLAPYGDTGTTRQGNPRATTNSVACSNVLNSQDDIPLDGARVRTDIEVSKVYHGINV